MNNESTRKKQPYEGAELPLPPSLLRLSRRQDGQYAAEWDTHQVVVQVTRCFPWTEPNRHISLRDADERELCFVTTLDELDPESRAVLQQALDEVSFVIEITGIDGLQEEYEIRTWRVRTVQGQRAFQTKKDEWPQEMPNGGLLIRDVAGDLFCIRGLDRLDAESRKRLSWYVD